MKSASLLPPTITRLGWAGLLSAAIASFPLSSGAIPIEAVTNPREAYGGWVSDEADLLSDRTEAELNRLITNLEAENGSEIAVVTVPDTAPSSTPKAFATELFNYWGIGKAEADNGILFLISEGDRRVEIETGYGIEPILPDAQVGEILATHILPQLKEGNFDQGTLAGTIALIDVVRGGAIADAPTDSISPEDATDAATAEGASSASHRSWLQSLLGTPWYVRLAIGGSIGSLFLLYQAGKAARQPIVLKPGETSRHRSLQSPDSKPFWIGYLGTSGLVFSGVVLATGLNATTPANAVAAGLFLGLLGGAPLSGVAVCLVSPYKSGRVTRPRRCQTCQNTLRPLLGDDLVAHLSQPQQKAKELGSVSYAGWHCPHCEQAGRPHVHIVATVQKHYYYYCPECRELTMTRTHKTTQRPTVSSTGIQVISDRCHCCQYVKERQVVLARLKPQYRQSSSSSSSGSYYGGGFSGGGGCSGGGGGGGGGFGGGSSGGGGCGGGF